MTELKLEHIKHCLNGNWYWICPICKEWLLPHKAGMGRGHYVLQSKGAATKHLMSHNVGYIPNGKTIMEIVSKKQYFCNDCDQSVISMKYLKDMNVAKDIKTKSEHKYMCFGCAEIQYEDGLKTKDEVHKGEYDNKNRFK